MEIYIILTPLLNLIFLYIGLKIGMASKKEEKETSFFDVKNPMQIYKEHKSSKETEMQLEEINKMMDNINNYDGTSNHQQDF